MLVIPLASLAAGLSLWVWDNRRHNRRWLAFPLAEMEQPSLWILLLASFLTLFAELTFIRWLAVEVRVFAYFKNLALLVCFLGFGFGCALARKPVRWPWAIQGIAALLVCVRLPIPAWQAELEQLSTMVGGAADTEIWKTGVTWHWGQFLAGAVIASALLFLVTAVFVPMGQIVGRQLDLAQSRLGAYSWNLFGSLAGIVAFLFVCRQMYSPAIWFAILLGGVALLQEDWGKRALLCSLILPAAALLHEPDTPAHRTLWTPYQQIEFTRILFPSRGEWASGNIRVNRTGYQMIVDLSPQFLGRHPDLLKGRADDHPYNLPYRFTGPAPRTLVFGSGTGNDVAGALRNSTGDVDAVEIDPAILQLGHTEHPERPYASPRVHVSLNDARAFLRRTTAQYDLILFGLLDSHTQFSDYSNMRIDNFVYTRESIAEARQRLKPDGVLFVKFEVNRPWMGARIFNLLRETFHKDPVVFFASSGYGVSATCFVISPSDRVEKALAADPALAELVRKSRPLAFQDSSVPVTTDDWPYLYNQGKWIPRTYYSLGLLVVLLGVVLYIQIPEARTTTPSLFFFAMGAGFLLLETQVISRLALFFGTTWQVNGVVLSALLTALLAANLVVSRWERRLRRDALCAGLLLSLLAAYFTPFHAIPFGSSVVGWIAAAILSVPVFFAGLLFALEFNRAASPVVALGSNMLGAVLGGLMENLSFIFGMRSLLLFAFVLYAIAAGALWAREHGRLPALAEATPASD